MEAKPLRLLDLFSGIGGFSLGLEHSGLCKTVGFVEIAPHAQKVLHKHWSDVPIHGDIRTREFKEGEADVISGGFPCQDISCAGKRAGLTGTNSGLYRELMRAVRLVRPQFVFVENVARLLRDGMGIILGELAALGYGIEWDCVPASTIGAPHKRDRVFIIAHTQGIRCREGWPRRPPDSFARIRDEARRNAADHYGARLAFREGLTRDAWEKLTPAEREALGNERQSIWPDEPALQGVDDVFPYWMDRVRETGNALVPIIPRLLGEAIQSARTAP